MVTTSSYIKTLESQFEKIFEKSSVLKVEERAMVLTRPGSSIFRTEFISGQMGTLLVHGDGPDIMLRTYRDTTLLAKVEFLATNNYQYLSEKVVMGESYVFNIDIFDSDINTEIQSYKNELVNDEQEDKSVLEMISALESIRDNTESEHTFKQAIWDYYPDSCAYPMDLGQVPSTNFIMAKVAAKRVLTLL